MASVSWALPATASPPPRYPAMSSSPSRTSPPRLSPVSPGATCPRRSCRCCAPHWTAWSRASSGPRSRSPSIPVSDATAAVITAQQARVTARFADTPAGELALLPTPLRNPSGRKPVSISWLENRHREWANSLGPLRTRDGTPFDPARIVPYAYRHTYAQRHADAGVPIDVLAQLMDHKNLNQTRGYYRVGEDRRRAAVDKVTAMSFDRHGNRIWRDARDMLDAEHARYAIGSVAVPYVTCTEPSNVAAGGKACPVRFRCAGCDHFRTDVSYL